MFRLKKHSKKHNFSVFIILRHTVLITNKLWRFFATLGYLYVQWSAKKTSHHLKVSVKKALYNYTFGF
jgi:hypothetical protein